MTTMNWLTLLGVPTLVGLIVGAIFKKFQGDIERQKTETEAVKKGIQALLRAEMYHEYNKWVEKGYCPIYAKENFQNMFTQYEHLGMNGVMQGVYKTIMELPTEL